MGILNGMNGHYKTNKGYKIVDIHIDEMKALGFKEISLNLNKEFDHRKILFFFTIDETVIEITLDKLEEFIEKIYVGAILIGSSNQSNTTYFEKTAKKGEADIFMFDTSNDEKIEDFINYGIKNKQNIDQNSKFFDDIVIAESFYGRGHDETQKFFKEILKDVLKNGLEK